MDRAEGGTSTWPLSRKIICAEVVGLAGSLSSAGDPPGKIWLSVFLLLGECVFVCMCMCMWVHVQQMGLLGGKGSSGLWLRGSGFRFHGCSVWCVSFTMLPLPAYIPRKEKKVQYNTLFFIYFFIHHLSHQRSHIAGYFRKPPFSAQYLVGTETAKEVLAAGVARREHVNVEMRQVQLNLSRKKKTWSIAKHRLDWKHSYHLPGRCSRQTQALICQRERSLRAKSMCVLCANCWFPTCNRKMFCISKGLCVFSYSEWAKILKILVFLSIKSSIRVVEIKGVVSSRRP